MDDPEAPDVRRRRSGSWRRRRRPAGRRTGSRSAAIRKKVTNGFRPGSPRCAAAPATTAAKPDQQAGRQQVLPETPDLQVFPALVADPEPPVAEQLRMPSPLAEQAADDHDHERRKEHVHERARAARIAGAQRAARGTAPRQHMRSRSRRSPFAGARCAAGCWGECFQVEAVEAARLGAIVRDGAADQGLREEQQRDHHQELHQRALPCAGLHPAAAAGGM